MSVGKNSWEHTAVQWTEQARRVCPELAERTARRPDAPHPGCRTLSEAITRAAQEGAIPISDTDPVPRPMVV
ncbi:hypothetical protein [Rhodococcus rhodnii]|uniref:Uncharacterized protein n=1 Tax=Rhodococcus rhodnii LMG 5362 TaxID=1273125 RepID=R7WQ98_9NOCA|nr:hypothetical protein Rrhod_1155 [Rhodococcus rhodnii LMG 5362]